MINATPATNSLNSPDSLGALLAFMNDWYASECNGDWEHSFGIKLETIDNPGWLLKIDLSETTLEGIFVKPVQFHRNETDWYQFEVKNDVFLAGGGINNISDLLESFRNFVNTHQGKPIAE